MKEIISTQVCSSGGGCYLFAGQLVNNEYFLASNTYFNLRKINRNPNEYDYDDIWMPSWQEECLIEDVTSFKERKQFFESLFEFFKINKPIDYASYNMSWMQECLDNYNECEE